MPKKSRGTISRKSTARQKPSSGSSKQRVLFGGKSAAEILGIPPRTTEKLNEVVRAVEMGQPIPETPLFITRSFSAEEPIPINLTMAMSGSMLSMPLSTQFKFTPHGEIHVVHPPEKHDPARPSFDDIYMEFAKLMARRSTCKRAQVGAVVVTSDNHRVLAVGYNGGARGLFNDCLSEEPGKCGHLHAEVNALIKTNYHDAAQKKIYVTSSPCFNCAVAIINAGIREVIFLEEYRDPSGLALLRDANIVTRKHAPQGVSPRDVHVDQDRP